MIKASLMYVHLIIGHLHYILKYLKKMFTEFNNGILRRL